MTRIWLNHWFSSAYQIIQLIKAQEEDFYIVGSSSNETSVVKGACDAWEIEPVLEEEAYVDYCLEFCKKNQIDIFMPRRGMVQISKRKKEFEAIGTKVMVEEYSLMHKLNQKDLAYALVQQEKIAKVPSYEIVTNATAFQKAVENLSKEYPQVCFKFVEDEGARSFRVIDDSRRGFESLLHYSGVRITYQQAVEAFSERESFEPVMVMPYLSGQEVSVDCLKTSQGIIMVPRVKTATRTEYVRYDQEIMESCRRFYEKVDLEYPCNIQFRYLNQVPYFLEVNTRMSGGVQMSCLASGINIPNIAVNKMLGREKAWKNEYIEKIVSYVESPVIL